MQRRNLYQAALDKARRDLSRLDPQLVALRSGAQAVERPEGCAIELAYWGRSLEVTWRAGEVRNATGEPAPSTVQLLVLHYLITADGTPMADRWLSFRELPDGRVYDAAFRKRACLPLARAFGDCVAAFLAAGERLGGERLVYGDASLMFRVLPRVRVAAVLYGRDEEFPADVSLLFDASLRHYLPIEDVAVLGGLVAAQMLLTRASEAWQ